MREDGIIASNINKVDNRLILDVRQKYQYDNDGHIEGSANIIPDITILNKIPKNFIIIFVDYDETTSREMVCMMKKCGYIAYFLIGGITKWKGKLVKNVLNTTIVNFDLVKLMKQDQNLFLLDVREPNEFITSKISNATNIPLSELSNRQTDIPLNKKIVTICSRGNRSTIASAILAKFNMKSSSLIGGMSEWNKILNYEEILVTNELRIIRLRKLVKDAYHTYFVLETKL